MNRDEASLRVVGGPWEEPPLPGPGGLCHCAVDFALPGREEAGPVRAAWEAGEESLAVELPGRLGRAVGKRRAEYLAGRLCAMIALRALTGTAQELPAGPGRAPCWPEGISGSISHSSGRAMAVVARAQETAFLGIDYEPVMSDARARPLGRTILTPGDEAFCPEGMGTGAFTTLVFSAKEAVYKAVWPRVGRVIDFSEARLTGHWPGEGRLEIVFDETVRAPGVTGRVFALHYRLGEGRCLTLCAEPG